jgi:predicted Fe-Mo cluster-binding NifX family protein
MRVIISAILPNIQSEADPRRFGRSAYFLEVDPGTLEWKAYPNPDTSMWTGASVRVAQFVTDRKADAVISGGFDQDANAALDTAGVAMFLFKSRGTVRDVIARFRAGELQRVGALVREEHYPVG